MKKKALWTPTFVINMGLNFIYYFAYYMLTVIITVVAINDYHASASMAGLLSGIFILGGFVGRLWVGSVIVRIGAKRALYIGTLIFLVMTFPYYWVHSVGLLLILRFLHGIGFGIAATASGTLAGIVVPTSRRGEGIGYYALSVTMASAAGPFLSIFLYHLYNFTLLIHLALVLSVLSLIGVFFLKVPQRQQTLAAPVKTSTFNLSKYFEKSALPIAAVAFLVGLVYSSILTFMSAYGASIHLVTASSVFYVVYAIFILISRPFTGRLFDSRGDNFILYPSFLALMLCLLLTGMATNTFVLLTAAAFLGLGYGSFPPFGQAIAIRESGLSHVGTATSTLYGFLDMGVGLGPLILGLVEPAVGYRGIYFVSGAFVIVIAVLYFFVHGNHQKSWYRRYAKAELQHLKQRRSAK